METSQYLWLLFHNLIFVNGLKVCTPHFVCAYSKPTESCPYNCAHDLSEFFGELVRTFFFRLILFFVFVRWGIKQQTHKSQLSLSVHGLLMKATLQFEIRPKSNFSQILTSLMETLKVDSCIATKQKKSDFSLFLFIVMKHNKLLLDRLF